MSYLLDTNHWSYLHRNHAAIVSRIAKLPPNTDLFMSVVTQGEILAGIENRTKGRRRTELTRVYERELRRVAEVLVVDTPVAEQFAQIHVQLRRTGKPVGTNDMWIAATALAHDLTVVSNDAHFRCIDGLRVEDWTQAG